MSQGFGPLFDRALQVFMGFVWDGEQTYYDRLKGGGFKALPEKAAA